MAAFVQSFSLNSIQFSAFFVNIPLFFAITKNRFAFLCKTFIFIQHAPKTYTLKHIL